jgi:uncharacterized protein (DUF302 family)
MAQYTIRYDTDREFDETVAAVEDALADEGFGVLCDVDVQATLREKLDADFGKYRILGACNPGLAHEALGHELELGALLPCNVVVFETEEGAVGVSAVDPERLLGLVADDALDPIASDVASRLTRAIESVPGAEPA